MNGGLKRIFESELDTPARSNRVRGLAKTHGSQKSNRNPEVRAIDEVKNICPKAQFLLCSKSKTLHHGEVQFQSAAGTKTVTANAPILEDGSQKSCGVSGTELQWLTAIAGDNQACNAIETIR